MVCVTVHEFSLKRWTNKTTRFWDKTSFDNGDWRAAAHCTTFYL